MAIIDSNSIWMTSFEPKQENRFIVYCDGIPSFMIKKFGGIKIDQGEVKLPHINVDRWVKGKSIWGEVNMTLWNPITPSGEQVVMEWIRLHHESVTGRDGYSDFYKKDLTLNILGPVGDVVSEIIIKGSWIKSADFGEYAWETENKAKEIALTLRPDYVIVNF